MTAVILVSGLSGAAFVFVLAMYIYSRRQSDWNSKSFMLDANQIVLEESIGKGSYATVYRASYQGTEVAVKVCIIIFVDQ